MEITRANKWWALDWHGRTWSCTSLDSRALPRASLLLRRLLGGKRKWSGGWKGCADWYRCRSTINCCVPCCRQAFRAEFERGERGKRERWKERWWRWWLWRGGDEGGENNEDLRSMAKTRKLYLTWSMRVLWTSVSRQERPFFFFFPLAVNLFVHT